jgi:CRP-like cAMP-binding protein
MGTGAGKWKSIFPSGKVRSFGRGEVMVAEGDKARELLILLSGRARVEKRIGGREPLVLARPGAGQLIGELSILTGHRRSATVVAESPAKAWSVPTAQVRALLGGGSGPKGRFQKKMMQSLAHRLVGLLGKLPVLQGVSAEPQTEAAVRKALEKMYGGWAV